MSTNSLHFGRFLAVLATVNDAGLQNHRVLCCHLILQTCLMLHHHQALSGGTLYAVAACPEPSYPNMVQGSLGMRRAMW